MSFLGKIGGFFKRALPIAAGFIPGIGPLASMGIGAATGALTGGKKGALIGGLLGGVGGAGAAGKLGNLGKVLTTGKVGQTLVGQNGQGGLLQSLLSGDTLKAAATGAGAVANTQAHNRGVKLDAMMDADRMKLDADRNERDSQNNAMKSMQHAAYLKSGGFKPRGPVMSSSGKPINVLNFGARESTPEEIEMASTLEGQLMNRLKNPIALRDYDSQMDPSMSEKLLGYSSPVLSILAAARGADKYELPKPTTKTPTPNIPLPVTALGPLPGTAVGPLQIPNQQGYGDEDY